MVDVLLALLPVAAVQIWLFGWPPLLNLLVGMASATLTEALLLHWRGRAPGRALRDGSALVTAALLCLALPPAAPVWLPAVGCVIAIALGKQVFGGLGQNPFNPAMVAYAFLLISFPVPMTHWLASTDADSGATALETLRLGLKAHQLRSNIMPGPAFGALGDARWQWVGVASLAGGLWLLLRRRIGLILPLATLAGLCLPATVAWLIDPQHHASPLFQLFAGATLYSAFFIVTDPVTAPASDRGRALFGLGVGALIWLLRGWSDYPDAFAFAVLLMNLCVPVLDRHTVPPAFGRGDPS